jgi:hypothetical protein
MTRRSFITDLAAGSGLLLAGSRSSTETEKGASTANSASPTGAADVTLRIGPVLVEIAKDHTPSAPSATNAVNSYIGAVPVPQQ